MYALLCTRLQCINTFVVCVSVGGAERRGGRQVDRINGEYETRNHASAEERKKNNREKVPGFFLSKCDPRTSLYIYTYLYTRVSIHRPPKGWTPRALYDNRNVRQTHTS